VKEEQSYSKQPLLLAHPSSVKAMKDGMLNQLKGGVKNFMEQGYMI
jgi:hypothetical protein